MKERLKKVSSAWFTNPFAWFETGAVENDEEHEETTKDATFTRVQQAAD